MLLKIIRYVRGYIRIRIAGYSAERFLNACSHRGIILWGLEPAGRAYETNISIEGFRKLKPIIRKTGTKVSIVERSGLPFFLHKYRKRKMFFGGAFVFLALVFVMSRYIWNIDITGNQTYTDDTLLKFLETREVRNGMQVKEVDCARIVKDIRKEYDDIIWVSASIRGTRLIIQVKENEDTIPDADDAALQGDDRAEAGTDVYGNAGEAQAGENGTGQEEQMADRQGQATDIVADRDCVITKLVPRSGIPMVSEGAEVKAGDILVSGHVPVVDDAGTVVAYQSHVSDADIQGRTVMEYQDGTGTAYEKKEYIYRKKEHSSLEKVEYFLKIGDYDIRLGSIENQYDSWEMHAFEKQLCIGANFYLPVFYGKRTAKPYDSEGIKYTETEIRQRLSGNFQRYCKDLEKKGVEIIENDVKIYTGSQKAEARGRLTVLMPVGTQAASGMPEIGAAKEQEETSE